MLVYFIAVEKQESVKVEPMRNFAVHTLPSFFVISIQDMSLK